MLLLDNPDRIKLVDKQDMLGSIENFPQQCAEALNLVKNFSFPKENLRRVKNIAIIGMGGSGIAGDVVACLGSQFIDRPVTVIKGYQLPSWINENSLVFAVSYSGNTEETIFAFNQALQRQANVLAISSGGSLAKLSSKHKTPWLKLPSGFQPRAALGYLTIPICLMLEEIGLWTGCSEQVSQSIDILKARQARLNRLVETKDNPAKQLAMKLVNQSVIIYGSQGPTALAAQRWKCQLNENAKITAFWNQFSELNHNEIMGWNVDNSNSFHLVLIRSRHESRQMLKRIEITKELLKSNFKGISEIMVFSDNNPWSEFLSGSYFGDFVSVYLAILLGVNPTSIKAIENLKSKLRE
jgi:glucose/mannose-6-phosphate isomerase